MPISSNTISELKRSTAHFDFLLTASNIKIKNIPSDQRFCVICQEPFDNNVWQYGTTVNRPVKLECGHIIGIQCLAHLVFTSDFTNRCPLCRAQIMPDSFDRNPSGQSWKAAVPLLRLLMMFGGDLATFSKQKALDVLQNGLEKEGLTGTVVGKHMHRIMVLYEEFLNQFCDHPQQTGDAARLVAAEARVNELLDLARDAQEVRRRLVEARDLRAQQEEIERYEREKVLRDVREELEETKKELKETQEELQGSKKEYQQFRIEELKAWEEFEGVMQDYGDATKNWKETEIKLEETKKKLEAVTPSALVSILLGMTIAAVLVHIEHHILEPSATSSFVIGVWLIQCVIVVIRNQPSRKTWLISGLMIVSVALALGAFSKWDRFAL